MMGTWLLVLTQSVIANEKCRIIEDGIIKTDLNIKYAEIITRLTRIETKVEERNVPK